MRYLYIILTCVLCITANSASAHWWEEQIITTQEDIIRWFEQGVKEGATHLLVVNDQFDYDDFPDYVYWGQSCEERVNYWNSQDLFQVIAVYDLYLDMNSQLRN